jgi:cellulose synthase/poly-beta-1,6-N-acetylglucosamine synthase-like glycosyltransferase
VLRYNSLFECARDQRFRTYLGMRGPRLEWGLNEERPDGRARRGPRRADSPLVNRDSPPSRVSVVICAYTLDRWADLVSAVESARDQTLAPTEVIVVADHNDDLLRRAAEAWPQLSVIASSGPRGLSGARNTGLGGATGDIVAFLDDDARAEPTWLAELVAPFADARVVATGGHAESSWDGSRPAWFPREFDWVVGCSYIGLPRRSALVRNPIGCNMSFRRVAAVEAGGFRSDIGRVGRFPVGGEETELCIRIRRRRPDARIVYVPEARVRHHVTAARSTWAYFRSRCYQEGRSKALISSIAGAGTALASERSYASRTLPAGVLRNLGAAVRGDPAGVRRAAAIGIGLAITTGGYLAGRLGLDALPVDGGATG